MYGERLRKARKNMGMTLAQVAQLMNTTHATISRYEHEKRKLDPETIVTFCKLYNISSDYVLGLPQGMPYPEN